MNLKNIYSQICTNVSDFSKIADLQARSAALGAALRACISAIFQSLKHEKNGWNQSPGLTTLFPVYGWPVLFCGGT